jgi:C4-dicarboxylate-specific signal transduction histidine kinase
MHNIIKLLKSFSYKDDDSVEHQDLAHLIEQSLRLIHDSLLEKNITLKLDQLEPSVYVRINPLKFDLVIANIIQNAMDAMEKCDNAMIKVAMSAAAGEAMLTIEDLGDGIDSRMMGQLFDPYFTTKEIGKGLGLGLSICHEIVREYGGRIQAENTPIGAKFIICLPLSVS